MDPINDSLARIQEIAKMLPPEKLQEVLDFKELIEWQESNSLLLTPYS